MDDPYQRLSRRNAKYWGVALFCAATVIAPMVLILLLVLPFEPTKQKATGVLQIQSGQAIITQKSAEKDNTLRHIMAAEELNQSVFAYVLNNPSACGILKQTTPKDINNTLLLQEDSPEALGEKLGIGEKLGVVWNNGAGPWGLFLAPSQEPPSDKDKITFGAVEIISGREVTRIQTERTLNQLWFEIYEGGRRGTVGKTPYPVLELLQKARAQDKIETKPAIQIVAAAEVLNIRWNPKRKLFLSSQTEEDFLP